MTEESIKINIDNALRAFAEGNITQNALNLFRELGYITYRQAPLSKKTFKEFEDKFTLDKKFDNKKAKSDEWLYVDLLFQLSKEEVLKQSSLFDTKKVDNTIIETYLFFVIELSKEHYTRTELSHITREVNRIFPMPVMVLFKHEKKITLSVINRRLHKRDESKDVLEKVTLIKDINIEKPHRAHIEILYDLSLDELKRKYQFTNFVELHNSWQKTLDTKLLNKKFFEEVSNWYFWTQKYVEFPKNRINDDDKNIQLNLIRLITRLIFVWFLKEKKLVPDYLFDKKEIKNYLKSFDSDGKSTYTYYTAILQNLFFATLNQKMNERGFVIEGKFQENKNQFGIKNLYRYAEQFNIKQDEVITLFKDIPFLNGGLFDCLDKENEETGKIEYIDGFSRNLKKVPKIPDLLFFGSERMEDLSEGYGYKRNKDTCKGLIEIFSDYKFTIEENTPIEEEIALDPELLGKVFENLLAYYNPETETPSRKQTGSFYTPRDIVNYMVDESLLEYIKQNVKIVSEDFETRLRELISYAETATPFDEQETKALIECINNCKILDPACGSGAFPMGILHKMVHLLQKLDPENKHWKALQRQKAMQETEAAFKIGDKEERRKRLAEINDVFENNASDYGRKLYLIENCIYGIDIQPIAVQISKLRFFISLIIDQNKQTTKENFGIRSLPNLETKFVAANTLIGLDIPTNDLFAENNPIKKLEIDLKSVRHEYFAASNRKEKIRLQKEDKKLRKQISELIKDQLFKKGDSEIVELKHIIAVEKVNLKQIEKSKEDVELIKTTDIFGEITETIIDKKEKKIKAQKDRINNFEKELQIKGLANNKDAIAKVAEQIASFDPYDQNTYARWFDSEWMFGLTTGFDIVIGNPPYKVVSKADQIKYKSYSTINCGDLYAYFIEKSIKGLLKPNGTLSFITASLFIKGLKFESLRVFLEQNIIIIALEVQGDAVFENVQMPTVVLIGTKSNKKTNNWSFDNFIPNNDIIKLIEANSKSLSQICDVMRGFEIGRDQLRDKGEIKFISGSDVVKWGIKKYSYITKEIENDYKKNEDYFKGERILIRETGSDLTVLYLKAKLYCNRSLYSIKVRDMKYSSKYIAALLNSSIFQFYYQSKFKSETELFPKIRITQVKQLPIRYSDNQNRIDLIVDFILTLKYERLDSSFFERLLNAMVYELYLPEEIKTGGAEVLKHLNNLPELIEGQNERNLKIIEKVYKELSDPKHPISAALLKLLTIEEVNIIEGRK